MALTQVNVSRVPVEHRWLGLDRRSLPYALVAFGVIAVWAWVLPWANDRVAWDDQTRAGDVLQVTDDLTMTVPPGWGVVAGLRTTDETRGGQESLTQDALVKNGVMFSILQGPFDDDAVALLGQAELITGAVTAEYEVAGEIRDLTTASGLRGVSQSFTYGTGAGIVTTFVVDGTGLEFQVTGPRAQVTALQSETDAMIDSLAQDGDS